MNDSVLVIVDRLPKMVHFFHVIRQMLPPTLQTYSLERSFGCMVFLRPLFLIVMLSELFLEDATKNAQHCSPFFIFHKLD